ncbi:hypothetical protein [Paenibacillus illinoisensis]|uniref:Uncharacterized protein n=1 Tax=Paenibacillus illinoisensis TaxID=59845 RepID=A0A2W0CJ36_9BACL|nr:hypothetical protein [Paenibacillus illinoisensis]PYY28325.1 Uncharacterized protein PIL02S_03476 [Paenibacillus illinoisensis]
MKITILYGAVLKFAEGGIRLGKTSKDEESVIANCNEIINEITKKGIKNIEVYISQLEYDENKNCIVADKFIDEYSELLYPVA